MSVPENEIIYGKDFVKDARRLPVELQNKLADLVVILGQDGTHLIRFFTPNPWARRCRGFSLFALLGTIE